MYPYSKERIRYYQTVMSPRPNNRIIGFLLTKSVSIPSHITNINCSFISPYCTMPVAPHTVMPMLLVILSYSKKYLLE